MYSPFRIVGHKPRLHMDTWILRVPGSNATVPGTKRPSPRSTQWDSWAPISSQEGSMRSWDGQLSTQPCRTRRSVPRIFHQFCPQTNYRSCNFILNMWLKLKVGFAKSTMRFDLGSIFIRRLSYANIPPPLGIYKDNRLLKIIGKSILRRSLRCCNIIQIKTYMVRYITPDNYLLSFYGQLWRCGLYNRNVTNCFRVTCQLY